MFSGLNSGTIFLRNCNFQESNSVLRAVVDIKLRPNY